VADSTVQSIEIDAPPARCLEVAADIAAYPEWATGVRTTEILDRDDTGRVLRAHFVVDGMVKEITYVLDYTYPDPYTMSWIAEPGPDLAVLEGSYTFRPLDGDRTEAVYALRADPTFTLPGFVKSRAVRQIVGTALRGLRDRVQSLAGV